MNILNHQIYRMMTRFLLLFLCLSSTYPTSLLAQIINDEHMNYYTEIYRLKWNVNTEDGAEDPVWRWKYSASNSSIINTECDDGSYSSYNWCYTGANGNDLYPYKELVKGGNAPLNKKLYTAFHAQEWDVGSACGYGWGDDNGHCRTWYYTIKQPNTKPGQFHYFSYDAYNDWSEGTLRFVWRYGAGDYLSQPLRFETIANNTWYNHYNSNRASPTSRYSIVGYSNQEYGASPDVVYSFVISEPSSVTISTVSSNTNFDTYLRLLDNNDNLIAENNDYHSGTTHSQLTHNLCAGTYKVVVEGTNSGQVGDFQLYVRRSALPATTSGEIALNGSEIVPIPQEESSSLNSSVNAYLLNINNDAAITWERRPLNGTWETIVDANAQNYNLPELSESTEFRRVATGSCGQVEYSNIITVNTIIPIGVIRGQVVSPTGSAVLGATVCVQRNTAVPGGPTTVEYCSQTINDGTYVIDNIYYGVHEDGVEFTVTPSKVDPSGLVHEFSPESTTRILNPNIPVENDVDFTDETVYSVTGTIIQNQEQTDCPIADVEIWVNGQFLGNKTDENGQYALTMGEPDVYTIEPRYQGHVFSPVSNVLMVNTNVENIDFSDTQMRTLSGYLRADCDLYIGQAVLEIFDEENCFIKTISTHEGSGYYEIELPARSYSVQVSDFTIKNNWELIDHKDEVINFFSTKTIDLTNDNQNLDFVYHHPPIIQVVGLPDLDNCGYSHRIVEQAKTYPLEVKVWQVEPGAAIQLGCPVLEGQISIIDNISTDNSELVNLDILNGKIDYNLVPGNPNIVAPYLKNIAISAADIFSNFDRLAQYEEAVLVTGARPRPGTPFTTVSPEIPLLILRDPPGDGSSSFFEQSSTFESALRMYVLAEGSVNTWASVTTGTEFEAGLGISTTTEIWGEVGASLEVSATAQAGQEYITAMTTTNTFSTSNNPEITGSEGDVFIGAAMNLLYNIADEVIFDLDNCEVIKDKSLIIGNNGFDTHYIYTEDHIRNTLIPQLQLLRELSEDEAEANNYTNQISVWQQTLIRNEQLKAAATFSENVSFSSAAPYNSSTSFSTTDKTDLEFLLEIESSVSSELGLEIAGVGAAGGSTITMRTEVGSTATETNMSSMTTGYTLYDDDQGDFFSVNIKKDPVYKTPVFEMVGSTSSCPAEEGSQPRDAPHLSVVSAIASGIDADDEAEFTLKLRNISPSEETRTYALRFSQASNPHGAEILVGGSPYISPIDYTIAYNTETQVTVKVRQGASNVFSYEGLSFELYAVCDPAIKSTTSISTFFNSPCSDITLAEPSDDWVINQAANEAITLTLMDYDVNDLDEILLQYSLVGLNGWQTVMAILPEDLSTSQFGTEVTWNIANSSLTDGKYQLRLRLNCGAASVYSQRITGTIDRKAPEMISVPEPVDDNLVETDEIAVYFSETLKTNTNRNNAQASLRRLTDDATFNASVQVDDNKITINSDELDLSTQQGLSFEVTIMEVMDLYDNSTSEAITWQFTVSENYSGTVLPLQLLHFTGKTADEYNVLQWKTANESLIDVHIIERSLDASNFEELMDIKANNQREISQYEWLDEQAPKVAYYRLRSVDYSGKEYLSDLIRLERPVEQEHHILSLFPNPTRGRIQLEVSLPKAEVLSLTLVDMTGKMIWQESREMQGGRNLVAVDLETLIAGTYFLRVQGAAGWFEVRKVMKQ